MVGSWKYSLNAGRKFPLVPVGDHDGYVSSLCFIGDDRTLVSASGDSFVKVWDVGEKRCKNKLTHAADVLSVAAHPDDPNLIIAGGSDLECRIWDIRMYRPAAIFEGADSDVEHVAFNPAMPTFFVSASADGVCRIYDYRHTGSRPVVATPTQPFPLNTAVFSPDGRWLLAARQNPRWVIYDAYSGKEVKEIEGHADVISCLSVSPVTNSNGTFTVCTGSWDNSVMLWEVQAPNYWADTSANSKMGSRFSFNSSASAGV